MGICSSVCAHLCIYVYLFVDTHKGNYAFMKCPWPTPTKRTHTNLHFPEFSVCQMLLWFASRRGPPCPSSVAVWSSIFCLEQAQASSPTLYSLLTRWCSLCALDILLSWLWSQRSCHLFHGEITISLFLNECRLVLFIALCIVYIQCPWDLWFFLQCLSFILFVVPQCWSVWFKVWKESCLYSLVGSCGSPSWSLLLSLGPSL